MMKTFVLVLVLTVSKLYAFGQAKGLTEEQYNISGAIKIYFADSLSQVRKLAYQDIANGTPFLLLSSGIDPIFYSTDKDFELKYKAYYFELGCTGPTREFVAEYNRIIFAYLTERYGNSWKKKVRKDVVGLSD